LQEFIMSKSQELFQKAQVCMPGGVNSPVRAFRSVKRDPLFIESGKGAYLYDADGKEYIDFVGSWGPLILGHTYPSVLEAIQAAAAKGTSFGAPTRGEIELAEQIIKMVPSVEMVRMVNSGTEATMSAVRLARGATGRDKIIKFEGCYHGHGDSFLIKAGSGALTLGEPDSPGVPKALAAETLTAEYNNLESVKELFANYSDEIAAVIVEPIAGNMGVVPPVAGFLEGLRALCDQAGSVLIFDEVMTGFRVASGCAQELYGVTPDLTTLGKIVGGGFPAAAYGGKKELMEQVSPAGPIYQAGTLSGNPLAVAAGLATLREIAKEGFYEELNAKSVQFFEGTKDFIAKNSLPLQLNYVNSMGCLFFNPDKVVNFAQATASDTDKFARHFSALLDAGIYTAPSQFEAMFISAAHSAEDMERTQTAVEKSLLNLFS
jgi:glutamate-1-semialdehyde 2,1-aminomutase